MIDFKERDNNIYNDVNKIQVIVNEFKTFNPYINDTCNKLIISCDDKTKDICLDEDVYELDEILEGLTENLEDISICCELNDEGYVVIHNTDNVEFKIDGTENSFLSLLGFTNKVYEGETEYIAENLPSFNIDMVYVYMPNIDKTKPICSINSNLKVKMLYNSRKKIGKLDCVVVHIKDRETTEREYFHNFCGIPPKLKIRID